MIVRPVIIPAVPSVATFHLHTPRTDVEFQRLCRSWSDRRPRCSQAQQHCQFGSHASDLPEWRITLMRPRGNLLVRSGRYRNGTGDGSVRALAIDTGKGPRQLTGGPPGHRRTTCPRPAIISILEGRVDKRHNRAPSLKPCGNPVYTGLQQSGLAICTRARRAKEHEPWTLPIAIASQSTCPAPFSRTVRCWRRILSQA